MLLVPKLLYDLRIKGGWKGRSLAERVVLTDGTVLEVGDRLEPSRELLDVGDGFDLLTVFPVLVTFWRASLETIALHRNPLWNPDTGATHDKIMGVDSLHTFAIGVFLLYCQHVTFICYWLGIHGRRMRQPKSLELQPPSIE